MADNEREHHKRQTKMMNKIAVQVQEERTLLELRKKFECVTISGKGAPASPPAPFSI